MPPTCLTVLVPIRPGEEDALRAVLRPIGDDIKGTHLPPGGRPHISFTTSHCIHFARFAILSDPDRGCGRGRLLYAAVFDGSIEAHAHELTVLTSDLNAIWQRCEGFPGHAGLAAFLALHAHEPAAYYIAFRDETVVSIREAVATREALDRARDAGTPDPPAAKSGPLQRAALVLGRVRRAAPIGVDLIVTVARNGIANVSRGTLRILASLNRYRVFAIVNRLTGNAMPPRQSAFSSVAFDTAAPPAPLASGDEVPSAVVPGFREDVVTQNQLTLVTVIQPGRAARVRAVMSAIDSYAKHLAPSGSLIGISTIHFVRWLVIDDGRRLLMVSDYDGSWESYIDEFAEMILSGLDAIWETASGYPPDGARDVPAFKKFLRNHQVPSEVFYSAYSTETVLNIVHAVALRERTPASLRAAETT